MCDDFWGDSGWEIFENSMKKVFPDREIVDIPDPDAIFHAVYDLDDRYQVPGDIYLQTGVTEKCSGCPPAWLGIYDNYGRVHGCHDLRDWDIGGFLGVGRQSQLRRKILRAGHPHRCELCRLRHDPLIQIENPLAVSLLNS